MTPGSAAGSFGVDDAGALEREALDQWTRAISWSGTPHSQRASQEVEEPIGGRETEGLRCGIVDALECGLLHGEVGFDVLVGGGRVLVAEPEGNDGDVDSRLEQMHRGRVA